MVGVLGRGIGHGFGSSPCPTDDDGPHQLSRVELDAFNLVTTPAELGAPTTPTPFAASSPFWNWKATTALVGSSQTCPTDSSVHEASATASASDALDP